MRKKELTSRMLAGMVIDLAAKYAEEEGRWPTHALIDRQTYASVEPPVDVIGFSELRCDDGITGDMIFVQHDLPVLIVDGHDIIAVGRILLAGDDNDAAE